jgi:hypothetical protein
MPSGAQPRQSQAWQRYGRFMVNWRRKRSKAVRVFDLNTRGDPHEGQVFMGAPAKALEENEGVMLMLWARHKSL